MKFIKPVFYILTALLSLYFCYAIYISSDGLDRGVNVGLVFTLLLTVAAVLAMIIFPLRYMITHPKSAVRTFIALGALALVFVLSYALSGDEIVLAYEKVGFTSPTLSRIVGAGLVMMYLMLVAVLAAAVFAELRRLFK